MKTSKATELANLLAREAQLKQQIERVKVELSIEEEHRATMIDKLAEWKPEHGFSFLEELSRLGLYQDLSDFIHYASTGSTLNTRSYELEVVSSIGNGEDLVIVVRSKRLSDELIQYWSVEGYTNSYDGTSLYWYTSRSVVPVERTVTFYE